MRFCLIPIGYAGHIILAFKQSAMADANLLDRHPQIFLKQNGIHDVPPVKASLRQLIICMVIIMNLCITDGIVWVAQKRRTVRILHGSPVFLSGKAPGTADIIFRSRSADGGIFLISIQIIRR